MIRLPGVRPKTLLGFGANIGNIAQSCVRWGDATAAPLATDATGARTEIDSPGRLKKLRVIRTTTPAGGTSVVYTVRVNGVNTAITCTMANGPTIASDLVNSVAVVPGDVVEIAVTVGGGAPAASPTTVSLEQEF